MDQHEQSLLDVFELTDRLIGLHHFGLWSLTIPEAAELVALDMWYAGALSAVDEPEDWNGDEQDPKLRALLDPAAKDIEAKLIAAVEKGTLMTARVQRDFDDRVIPNGTLIDHSDLAGWLTERSYEPSDTFNEWTYDKATILELLCREAIYLKAESIRDSNAISRIERQRTAAYFGRTDSESHEDMQAAYKALVIENQQLTERLSRIEERQPAKATRPVSTRQRRTFLSIIAALCHEVGFDPCARGASQRIREMTERIGTPVDDGTIKPLLDEIPEALSRRTR